MSNMELFSVFGEGVFLVFFSLFMAVLFCKGGEKIVNALSKRR